MDISTALFSPESARNPYPLLARLRSEAPVLQLDTDIVASRHELVDYLEATIAARRRRRDDLLSRLTRVEGERPTWSPPAPTCY